MLRSLRLEKIFVVVENQQLYSNSALFFKNCFQFYILDTDSHFCKKDKCMKSD